MLADFFLYVCCEGVWMKKSVAKRKWNEEERKTVPTSGLDAKGRRKKVKR